MLINLRERCPDDKSLHECPIIETLMDDITERKEK